jgi:hypothetical protein
MTDYLAELPLGDQQPRANPALNLIAWPPAFGKRLVNRSF